MPTVHTLTLYYSQPLSDAAAQIAQLVGYAFGCTSVNRVAEAVLSFTSPSMDDLRRALWFVMVDNPSWPTPTRIDYSSADAAS